MLKRKNQKGITLVSLVITIVVLLLLAGVAINLAVDSEGIFGKAQEAADKWNTKVSEERSALEELKITLGQFDAPWSDAAAEGFKEGDGTEATPYLIENAEQLAYFAEQVNSGNTFEGKYIKVVDDIDLEYRQWTPIGNGTNDANKFKGMFDGHNHTISNLYIDLPTTDYVALFGFVEKGEIKNLTVNNANVKGNFSVGVIGGMAGCNCSGITLTGAVKVEGNKSGIGGIVGNMYGDITDAVINVTEDSYVKSNYWAAGGMVGQHYGNEISNATSNINVISNGGIGGILGVVGAGPTTRNYVNCSSSGTMSYTGSYGDSYAGGGIAGMIIISNSTINFTGCSFTGQVVKAGEVVEGKDIYGYDDGTNDIVIN